jgi:hypothetical protein
MWVLYMSLVCGYELTRIYVQVKGLRFQLTRRTDDQSLYDVSKVGPYRIPSSASVIISDPEVVPILRDSPVHSPSRTILRFASTDEGSKQEFLVDSASSAQFGPDILSNAALDGSFAFQRPALQVTTIPTSPFGCGPYNLPRDSVSKGSVLFIRRGLCTFAAKMKFAAAAGAKGVIVSGDTDEVIVPSAGPEDDLGKVLVPLVLVKNSTGLRVENLLARAESRGKEVVVEVIPSQGVLYLNGYALANVRTIG